jgi:hypothetical protein
LLRIKADLSAERQSLAKFEYVAVAGACAAVLLLVSWLLLRQTVANFLFPTLPKPDIVWAAIGGGTLGAVFSIATGISARTLQLEMRYRDNATDAGLRILVGAIGAAVLVSLQRSGLVTGSLLGGSSGHASGDDTIYFILGFLAGFSERLVPDMLAKINVNAAPPPTSPGAAAAKTVAAAAAAHLNVTAANARADIADQEPDVAKPADPLGAGAEGSAQDDTAEGEDCLCDGLPAGNVTQTSDVELPPAAGGVAVHA